MNNSAPMQTASPKAFEKPIAVGSPIHNGITAFYTREAWLLDHNLLREWMGLLTEDVSYKIPLRVTEPKAAGGDQISRRNWHYLEDYQSLGVRIHRIVGTKSAWSDDPQIRFRRFITNIAVGEGDTPDAFAVMSYVMVARNRFETETYQFLTAERHDVLRKDGDSFKVAAREVIIDLSVLGTPNLAFFI